MKKNDAQLIREYFREHERELIDFVKDLVLSESPSLVPDSQSAVFELLGGQLQASGFEVEMIPGNRSGGILLATKSRDASSCQLLLGHTDTVWPLGTLAEMPVEEDEYQVRGPGIFDMKGGLGQIVFALRALHALGLEPALTPVVLFNSDEEIGSFDSEPLIRDWAGRSNRVFVAEPALGERGQLKTARRGVGQFQIRVRGRASHAGLDPDEGVSAILGISHLVQDLFALNQVRKGISVNVGTIEGGLRPNVVAPECRAVVDVRIERQEDAPFIEDRIRSLRPQIPGATAEIVGGVGRPPLERTARNQHLWNQAQQAAELLGFEIEEGMAGGASDGNTTSEYCATLDGIGAVGGGAHARHEFVIKHMLAERAALLALLLLAPPVPGSL